MKKIRKNVFETNSSSTHSICIAKNATLEIPEEITLYFGEFGWEEDTLYTEGEKASYLYTGLVNLNRDDDLKAVCQILEAEGIKVMLEEPSNDSWADTGYIDHASELSDFLDDVCSDKDKLLNFLFSAYSFIMTGNDNSDSDVEIKVNYPHYEYYKDN